MNKEFIYSIDGNLKENITENFAPFFKKGKCPGGHKKVNCSYTYETTRDKENTTTCNSSCEKIYTYRQFKRQNNDPKECVFLGFSNQSAYSDCPKMDDKDIEWKTELLKCEPGEGNCPHDPVDCVSSYGKCLEEKLPDGGRKCVKKLNITTEAAHGGKECPIDKEIECSPDGDGCPYLPVDCKEAYSECQIINDTNAPSNIKGKCSKKNIIYKNSAHGGKLCKNETYVRCNDGEGSCPSDCKGIFSNCASNCKKKYKITSYAKNGGKECDYNNDQIIDCRGDNCIESIDCVGSWSNCDSNCEKTWNITTKQQGNGQNCRFRDGVKRKCTEDDDSKCKKIINKDCEGRWTTCDSNCKKEWIIENKASGSGTCDYSENTKYDCNEGVGNCLVSKDCIGRWKTCDENCKSKWELLEKEQGKNGRCDLIDGQEKSCVHGEGLCVINENNTTSTTDLPNDNNDNISQESKDQQMILYGIIALLILIIVALYL